MPDEYNPNADPPPKKERQRLNERSYDIKLTKSDMKLLEQAFRNRWPVPDGVKRQAMMAIQKILKNPKSSDRLILSATRTLILMEQQNMEDQHHQDGTTKNVNVTHNHVHAANITLTEFRQAQTQLMSGFSLDKPPQAQSTDIEVEINTETETSIDEE
jgi:hypothetical protein